MREAGNGTVAALNVNSIFIRRTDRIKIRDLTMETSDGKYAISFAYTSDFDVENIRYPRIASDGVHMNGMS